VSRVAVRVGHALLSLASTQHCLLSSACRCANSLADAEKLAVSRQHHWLMIEAMKKKDNWVLAQLCIDHLQPSKAFYLDEVEKEA
jgi:DNA-binding GntR family transcriptional regulator